MPDRIPDRDEVRALLEEHFSGDVTEAVVERVTQRLRAIVDDVSRRQSEDATYRANSVRFKGQKWKELMSYGQSVPRSMDLVPWLAVTSEEGLVPRPYTPAPLVGDWEQVEPRGGKKWTLGADGTFACGLERLAECKRWCVRRHTEAGPRGDELCVSEPDESDFEALHIDDLADSMLTVTLIGGAFENERFVLQRRRPGKRARTSEEMRFAASLEPCPKCGTRTLGELELRGQQDDWGFSGRCPSCGGVRSFTFLTHCDPHSTPPVPFELGPGASTLLTQEQLLDELVRVTPLIAPDPTALTPEEWMPAIATLTTALTCMNELLKLVERDGAAPRVRREWLDEENARLKKLLDAYVAVNKRKPNPEGELSRATLLAHQEWLGRGRNGEGRLVLAHHRFTGIKLGAAELTAARFTDVNLTSAVLDYVTLDEAELTRTTLDRAGLDGASFKRVRANGGSWTWARMAVTSFDGAEVDGTDFTESDLERSSWNGARVTNATFASVRFGNATFDGATFTHCDFRGASFAKIQQRPHPTTSARFEDCDLRDTDWNGRDVSGAVFVRCKLAGARGIPE